MLFPSLAGLFHYRPAPPFEVQYFCPRESPHWQRPRNAAPVWDLAAASRWALALHPGGAGRVRVVDAAGFEVFSA